VINNKPPESFGLHSTFFGHKNIIPVSRDKTRQRANSDGFISFGPQLNENISKNIGKLHKGGNNITSSILLQQQKQVETMFHYHNFTENSNLAYSSSSPSPSTQRQLERSKPITIKTNQKNNCYQPRLIIVMPPHLITINLFLENCNM